MTGVLHSKLVYNDYKKYVLGSKLYGHSYIAYMEQLNDEIIIQQDQPQSAEIDNQHTLSKIVSLPPLRLAAQNPDLMWKRWWFFTDGQQFTVQNLDQLYILVSSAHKTTSRDMTCTVPTAINFAEVILLPKFNALV